MITLAQIGAGAWGQNLLRTFSSISGCQIKICCEIREEIRETIHKNYRNQIQVTDNTEEVIQDPTIDAVVIATLPIMHASLAIRALEAGKHVFVEKPLALSIQEGEEMVRAAQKAGKILMVGHLLLYHPAIKKLKAYIQEGILGNIYYIYSTRVNLGKIREEENALWSLTAHDISVAMYLLEQMPIEVAATGNAYLRKNIHDVVFVTLNFNNNIMCHIHASWLDPHKIREFTVVGSKKMIVFDDMNSSEKLRLYDKGVDVQNDTCTYETFLTVRQADIYIPKIDMIEPLKLECQHFLDCIKKGQEPQSNGKNGLDCLKVLTAAQESLMSNGIPIPIL